MDCKSYIPTDMYLPWAKAVCRGTKGYEPCHCNGKMEQCTFYPEVRERAKQKPSEPFWFESNTRPKSEAFICSNCLGKVYYPQPTRDRSWEKHCPYKFCPWCGSKMKEGEDQCQDPQS